MISSFILNCLKVECAQEAYTEPFPRQTFWTCESRKTTGGIYKVNDGFIPGDLIPEGSGIVDIRDTL